MKAFTRIIFVLIAVIFIAVTADAQVWYPANQKTVAWNAVTVPSGTVSYKVYSKPESGGAATLLTTVATNQATVSFSTEGRFYIGVETIRTIDNIDIPAATISWSDVAAVCQNGATFGVQYYIAPSAAIGLRIVE